MRSRTLFIHVNGGWLCANQQHKLLKKDADYNQGHTFPLVPHPLLSTGSIGGSLVAFETLAADYLILIETTIM